MQDVGTEYLISCPEKTKVQCTALMAPEACKNSRRPQGGWLQGPESSVKNILLLRSGKKVGGSFQKKGKKNKNKIIINKRQEAMAKQELSA